MKNIQVIDSAINCAYSIYQVEDDVFDLIFPNEGQDIEFIEDFEERVGIEKVNSVLRPAWSRMIREKSNVNGIHGTLFYELRDEKKRFYPNKRETDFDILGNMGRLQQ